MRGTSSSPASATPRSASCPGRSTVSLNVEACRNALADAGDREGGGRRAVRQGADLEDTRRCTARCSPRRCGMQPRVGGVWDQGGATNISMISFAAMAIEAGQCESRWSPRRQSQAPAPGRPTRRPGATMPPTAGSAIAAGYAMIAQRHMDEFGTTTEQLGAIAVACRRHGANNPHAHLRLPLTLEQYRDSRYVVEPLRRDDCCLVSDGAAAVVVMSAKRARAARVTAAGADPGLRPGPDLVGRAAAPGPHRDRARRSRRRPRSRWPVSSRKDIDVAQIYDCFTIAALMTLEDYGFCAQGRRAATSSQGGRIELGGELPINTTGGLLSETGMPGLQLVHRGRAPDARHVDQPGEGRREVHRQQPGRHHAHALDPDPGAAMSFPAPEATPLSKPYWDALAEGRLRFQRCRPCGHAWLPPRAECPECWKAEWQWQTPPATAGW